MLNSKSALRYRNFIRSGNTDCNYRARVNDMNMQSFRVAAMGWLFLLLSSTAGAWSVNDNYDNQSDGQRCGSFWNSQQDSTVTSEKSSSGSKSCKMRITQGNKGWGGGFTFSSLKKGDEFWMRFRIFMPTGFNYNIIDTTQGDSNKFIRLTVKDTSGTSSFLDWKWENDYKADAYAVKLQRDNCTTNCWQLFGSANDKPKHGTWETYEIYAKLDNVAVDFGGQGRVRAWKNGKLIGDLTARRTINNSSDTVKSTHIFSYWNGGAPKTQHLYFDDLVATNVRPAGRDAQGNAYIGVGNFVAIAPPLPPASIQ